MVLPAAASSNVVIEIRVRWLLGLHENEDGNPTNGGTRLPDTPENRCDLRIIVERRCEIAGLELTGSNSARRRAIS